MSYVRQNLLPTAETNIPVRHYSISHAAEAVHSLTPTIEPPRSSLDPAIIGVSVLRNAKGTLEQLAFSTPTDIITISIESSSSYAIDESFQQLLAGQTGIQGRGEGELDSSVHEVILVGFEMPQIAVCLRKALGIRVRGVDLGTLCATSTLEPWMPGEAIAKKVQQNVDVYEINTLWNGIEQGTTTVCLRAWISAKVGVACTTNIKHERKIDTKFLNRDELQCLHILCHESYLLEKAKPLETNNEFSDFKVHKDGKLLLQNSRYSTRVRRSNQTKVIVTNESGREYVGRASFAKGKTTTIRSMTKSRFAGAVKSVRVVGREEPTNSEKAQSELLLHLLRGEKRLKTSFFIQNFWFPRWKPITITRNADCGDCGKELLSDVRLNPSQRQAAEAMISATPLVVTHGPPGTGKTTTIAAAAKVWDTLKAPTWIVAHSNVAVKNIAESLYKKSVNFVLIVSKEFYEEWHEHIYSDIASNLIRSDELPKDKVAMERLIKGSSIILSTLSMLSNPALHQNRTFDLVPVQRLVIDEASQIRVFEYMHVLVKFQNDLMKICFFGDPEQLPPYGIDKAPKMQTVFDLKHILKRDTSFFLDTQYRMPNRIGSFISEAVYQSKLKSSHDITTYDCLKFVDVGVHGEEAKEGFSWKNPGEVQTIVDLVKNYYHDKSFCVLSPYDAQRAAIERKLKAEKLPWENVYNVDSFQGNEAEYVIVSVVRSTKPGFLASKNRMNVLLTRCKKGLVIVTNRHFISNGGAATLVGRLAQSWESKVGSSTWVSRVEVLNSRAALPGVPSKSKTPAIPTVQLQSAVPPAPRARTRAPKLHPSSSSNKRPVPATPVNTPVTRATNAHPKSSSSKRPVPAPTVNTPVTNKQNTNLPPSQPGQVHNGRSRTSA